MVVIGLKIGDGWISPLVSILFVGAMICRHAHSIDNMTLNLGMVCGLCVEVMFAVL